MQKILVVAAVLDTAQLILYSPDGTETRIPQGDGRIKLILDQHTNALLRGETVEVDISPFKEQGLEGNNAYEAFEKKAKKGIKFFKVLRDAVSHLFGGDKEEEKPTETQILPPQFLGKVPVKPNTTGASTASNVADATQNQKMEPKAAINEIMKNATPSSSKDFEKGVGTTHTIVAQVGDKILPGAEALKDQVTRAAKIGSTEGVERLIARLTAVMDKRAHSVQDVLRFLEKGDLRVSDSGDIIAYKVLNNSNKPGYYVDCHTGRIHQRVGSYVCVDEALVDRDRRNECSNGLHIARRSYLPSFGGAVCTLTKIAPEDVVTVPHNDPNKVRVCGYHIIAVLPQEAWDKLRQNRPMTDNLVVAELVAKAIAGDHIGKIETVKVHGQKGQDVRVTLHSKVANGAKAVVDEAALEGAKAFDDITTSAVNPKTVSQTVVEKKQAQPAPAPAPTPTPVQAAPKAPEPTKSPAQQKLEIELQTLLASTRNLDLRPADRQIAAKELVEKVRKNKKGWAAVGLSESDKAHATGLANGSETGTKEAKVSEAAPVVLTKKGTVVPTPIAPQPKKEEAPVLTPATKSEGTQPTSTRQKDVLVLFNRLSNTNLPDKVRGQAARELVLLKKKAKVSYNALGLTQSQIAEMDEVISLTETAKTGVKKAEPTPKPPAKAQPEPKGSERKAVKAKDLSQEQVKAIEATKPSQPKNRVEIARELYQRALNDKTQWAALWLHKRKAKYSWDNLGFTKDEEKKIVANKPDHI